MLVASGRFNKIMCKEYNESARFILLTNVLKTCRKRIIMSEHCFSAKMVVGKVCKTQTNIWVYNGMYMLLNIVLDYSLMCINDVEK